MDQYNIWFEIFHKLDFKSQLALIFTCNTIKNNLFITDLYNIEEKYLELLDDNVLNSNIFKQMRKLKANKKITNVSLMTARSALRHSLRLRLRSSASLRLSYWLRQFASLERIIAPLIGCANSLRSCS